jgi:hypothetical protein
MTKKDKSKNVAKRQSIMNKLMVLSMTVPIVYEQVGTKQWWKELGKQAAITFGVIFGIVGYLILMLFPTPFLILNGGFVVFVLFSLLENIKSEDQRSL